MSDRRRIVRIADDGAVTTVKDLEVASTYSAVAGSFTVKAADRQTVMSASSRRYGGQTAVAESHGNGAVTWKALVRGDTQDAVIQNVEAMLSPLETPRGQHFEWRPDGATNSTYYEIRGPAAYQLTYNWAQFFAGSGMYVDVTIPTAPLAEGAVQPITFPSTTMPAVVALSAAVGGDAPAAADIAITKPGGTGGPAFALIGWSKRPATPALGVAPFGVIEAETGTNVSGWVNGTTDAANLRGGHALQVTTSGAGTAFADYRIDPSVMQPDEFADGTVDIEVWARVAVTATLVSPRITTRIFPGDGSNFQFRYTTEWGTAGKPLILPSSGTAYRLVRLGTLSMPTEPAGFTWFLRVRADWAAGSAGRFDLDYLVLVPARQRALSPTSEPLDASYPLFLPNTFVFTLTKVIGSDLSGSIGHGTYTSAGPADSGLGGTPIEFPPGNVDIVVLFSNVVPDDPTIDTQSMSVSWPGMTGRVTVTPRYWLARGA